MNRIAKTSLALAVSLILCCAPALAESTDSAARGFSAKGSVIKPDAITVTAPMGGQVQDFSLVSGDAVEEGAVAFALTPTQVYAAADGIVTYLRAQVGDRCQDVQAQYGALCAIERQDIWRIDASTSGAYDNAENRDVRVGQVLRVQHGTGDDKVKGEGTVIWVDGKDYDLEIAQGDFDVEDSVKIYKFDSKDNAAKDQMGSGKIVRAPAVTATGEGVVAQVLVKEGDAVVRGQPLFVLDAAAATYAKDSAVAPQVKFPAAGLIDEVLVRPGQFVVQGQAVMTLIPTGELEANLEVDELDIAKVRVGDMVRVHVDAFQQERSATVKEIRKIGVTVLDTTKFDVRVGFEQSSDLMIGMHVTGYWN